MAQACSIHSSYRAYSGARFRRETPFSATGPCALYLERLPGRQTFRLATASPSPRLVETLSFVSAKEKLTAFPGHTATSYASQSSIKSGSGAGTAFPCLPVQSESPTAAATVGTKPSAPAFPPIANPWGPHFATDDFPTHNFSRSSNSTRHNNAGNHYWCTVCEEPNSYKDSGNWKKHEKEHETIFVCGLDDAAEKTWAGRSHASKSFTCKRRDIMVNHLNKSHGIIEAHRGRDLADQWRHTMTKQAWSCGFCSSLFYTFQDRLKHVDIEHFRKHQSVNEWDLNKVILGLLQQPKMQRAWKTRAASLPPWVHPENLAWDKATAQGLRAKLEKGPSDDRHAITLADEAYSASKPNEASWHQSGVTLAKRHSEAPAQANSQSFSSPYQVIPALTSDSGLYHRPSSAITGSTAHLISRDASSVDAPTGAFAPSNTIKQSMPALNNEGRADHSSLLSKPSQSWTSASEPGTFFNGYELPESYGGQGAGWPIPNWYDG